MLVSMPQQLFRGWDKNLLGPLRETVLDFCYLDNTKGRAGRWLRYPANQAAKQPYSARRLSAWLATYR